MSRTPSSSAWLTSATSSGSAMARADTTKVKRERERDEGRGRRECNGQLSLFLFSNPLISKATLNLFSRQNVDSAFFSTGSTLVPVSPLREEKTGCVTKYIYKSCSLKQYL